MRVGSQFGTQGKSPQYPLHKRLGGPQHRSGRCEKEKILLTLPGIEPRFFYYPVCSSDAMPSEPIHLKMEAGNNCYWVTKRNLICKFNINSFQLCWRGQVCCRR
jgi:hypothetical protein